MLRTLGIPSSDSLLFVGLLLCDSARFLQIEWGGSGVPTFRQVPFRLTFNLSRVVVYSLGLAVFGIVARVPDAIVVTVYKETQVVSLGFEIIEFGLLVFGCNLFDHFIVAVEQLNDAGLAI